jgi:hypothetical protein
MATVDDAIEMLRDPSNLKEVGDGSSEARAVRSEQVVRLLRRRGAVTEQDALALIRKATRALGGDEVIVSRPSALHSGEFGIGPNRMMPAFWVPAD